MSTGWDRRFLSLAQHVSTWSKDPSTKCGAVITDDRNRIISVGYNGFPPGVADDDRLTIREEKYPRVVHAEVNAVVNAGRSVFGCALYTWPFMTCTPCAAVMLSAGLTCHVAPKFPVDPPERWERWRTDMERAHDLWLEAGAVVILYD